MLTFGHRETWYKHDEYPVKSTQSSPLCPLHKALVYNAVLKWRERAAEGLNNKNITDLQQKRHIAGTGLWRTVCVCVCVCAISGLLHPSVLFHFYFIFFCFVLQLKDVRFWFRTLEGATGRLSLHLQGLQGSWSPLSETSWLDYKKKKKKTRQKTTGKQPPLLAYRVRF